MKFFYEPYCVTVCIYMVSDLMGGVFYGVHYAIVFLVSGLFDPLYGMETADIFLLWFTKANFLLFLWKSFAVNC